MAKNIFNSIKLPAIGRNTFNLSHDRKMSFKMGCMVPTQPIECLPGDKFNISIESMLRFAPLVSPVMHKVHVTAHCFFVPNRILWNNWEEFSTKNDSGIMPPYTTRLDAAITGTLGDYMGYNTATDPDVKASVLPLAAYVKTWDEYYRDQNLQDERFIPLTDGDNTLGIGTYLNKPPFKRAWMHDYFTSALPFAQKGDAVEIPLGEFTDVPVELDIQPPPAANMKIRNSDGTLPNDQTLNIVGAGAGDFGKANPGPVFLDPSGHLKAKTSELDTEAATITNLRNAFRLQEFLEKAARGGTRYIESLMVHFGVKSSDARLNRPEYVGGTKGIMSISEVLSTADTVDANGVPVGTMAGHGISVAGGNRFSYYAEEHGHLVFMINVQPVTAYQQGLHRMFTRFSYLDYMWPSFQHIGEQEVKVKELYLDTTEEEGEETFGYVPRYAEYKYMNSSVAGEFKNSLSFWHMGRIFDSKPLLNEEFIEADPTTRIFAVQDGADHIYSHQYFNVYASRKMARYGIPSM